MTQKDQKQHNVSTGGTASHIHFLVEKARDGSRVAFADLVDLFQEDLFRMVYYRTRSRMDSEDIAQDVFIQAFKNLSKLRETNRFRGWLFSIALNRIRDFHRKKKFWRLSTTSDSGNKTDQPDSGIHANPKALDNLVKKDFWKRIGSFLDKLPRMEKEVYCVVIRPLQDDTGNRNSYIHRGTLGNGQVNGGSECPFGKCLTPRIYGYNRGLRYGL